jgi:LPXTG-motif cell wall-anchored protein
LKETTIARFGNPRVHFRFFALLISVLLVFWVSISPAVALPATTSWTNAGMQNMVIETGNVSYSADGCGDSTTKRCNVEVLKPAGATVRKAYFVIASGFNFFQTPTTVKLSDQAIAFTHKAQETRNPNNGSGTFNFANHLADVTSIVKPIVDTGATGSHLFAVDYSSPSGMSLSGAALTVIFDDPAAPQGSVIYNFGTTSSVGESFTVSFPPVTKSNLTTASLSIGVGWSTGFDPQVSTISLSPNGRANTIASRSAGGFDDGTNISVGGVGDNIANPANPTVSAADDELYSLQTFFEDGDTNLTVSTINPSSDDNIFQSIIYIPSVNVSGVEVGVALTQGAAGPAPTQSPTTPATTTPATTTPATTTPATTTPATTTPATTTPATTTPATTTPAARLATTGATVEWLMVTGLLVAIAGSGLLAFSRRKRIW